MKSILKKILPTFVYVVAVTGIVTLLLWYGSNYNYAFDTELGGDTPISVLFPPPDPFEAAKPEITHRDPTKESEGSQDDPPENPDETDPNNPDTPDGPDNPDEPDPDPPDEPEILWPVYLQNQTVYYSEINSDADVVCVAAVFDLEEGAVRFFAVDRYGEEIVSLTCTLKLVLVDTLSAEGGGIVGIQITVTDFRVLKIDSKPLCDFLGYSHPIYGGLITLRAFEG